MDTATETQWAQERFGRTSLGDRRRTERLVRMAAVAREAPAGRVADVFRTACERQGAYDILETSAVPAQAVVEGIEEATARVARVYPFVFVPVDGTSLTLVDQTNTKGFSSIGRRQLPTRGVKVITALSVSLAGVPLGLAGANYWIRPSGVRRAGRRQVHARLRSGQTEMRYWQETIARIEGHDSSKTGCLRCYSRLLR